MIYHIFFFTIFIAPYLFGSVWNFYIECIGDNIYSRVLSPWIFLMITYWTYGSILLLIDYYKKPALIYNTKYQKDSSKNSCTISRCIRQVLFNQIFVILPLFYVLDWLMPLNFSMPSILSFIYQIVAVILIGEVLYYIVHRSLHHASIYKYIHKITKKCVIQYVVYLASIDDS